MPLRQLTRWKPQPGMVALLKTEQMHGSILCWFQYNEDFAKFKSWKRKNGNIWSLKGSYYWREPFFTEHTEPWLWKEGYLKSLTSMRSDEGGVYRREDHDDDDDDGEICGYSNYHYK